MTQIIMIFKGYDNCGKLITINLNHHNNQGSAQENDEKIN